MGNDSWTLKNLDRRDPKKVAAFRVLVQTMEKNGMNTWEARMTARRLLEMPVPERKCNTVRKSKDCE